MGQFTGYTEETFRFFNEIKANNNKQWFEKNKKVFQTDVQQRSQDFVMDMDGALKQIAPEVGGDPRLNGSGSIFRIHRDVRFSKDKTPYKTHMGILFWNNIRKKMEGPGFYFHFEPPELNLFCGLWRIEKDKLDQYREAVADDKSGSAIVKILKDGKKQGFAMSEPHYKRIPSGYDCPPDRERLLLLNTLYFKYSASLPKEFYSAELIPYCLNVWTKMKPLYEWMDKHITD